jgi:hypothetical protein
LEGGTYANSVAVWHSRHEFTIDFAATLPPQRQTTQQGEHVVVVPQRITARVKVAPTMLFEIVRALNENLTRYEGKYGNVNPPGDDDQPLVPPDDWGPAEPLRDDEGDADDQDEGSGAT